MSSNVSNKLIFVVIDKKYDVNFIKSFVELTSRFNNDDGFYLINDNFHLYSPSYVNALICKYPYKKHNLSYLIKNAISSIKETSDDSNRYLIVFTDKTNDIEERLIKSIKDLNVFCLFKNEIDEEVLNFCFKEYL